MTDNSRPQGRTNQEPDWGKFGLDGEKQPLNPGSKGGVGGQSGAEPKDLYGGQVQDDNELFADDQVISRKMYKIVS